MTPPWVVMDLLRETVQYFTEKGIPTPRLEAEILLAHVLGCRRIDLYLRHDQPLTPDEVNRFREVVKRRRNREPIAYITGVREFWSIPFMVTPDVLIPRPETEALVEAALEICRSGLCSENGLIRILEIGTGSGAIAISLAVELGASALIVATDSSASALRLARENACANGVEDRIEFVEGDLFDPLGQEPNRFSMIISNPPYIPTEEISQLAPEIRDHEPKTALDGGANGLAIVRRILEAAPQWLGGGDCLLLEIGERQKPLIEAALQKLSQWETWRWIKDLQGIDRVLCARSQGSKTA